MAGVKNSKLKLLYLNDILNRETDEDHPLNASQLCEALQNYGITAERKSIYKDIEVLKEYGCDVIHNGSKLTGGYFIGSRKFEPAELRLLSDAVQAANFISAKKTQRLVEKIESMASKSQAKVLHDQVYVDNRPKCRNEELYYTISFIDDAIHDGVKITFLYSRRKIGEDFKPQREEKRFTVSPYAMIWMDDHYYLVCNNEKYDNLMHLRIDKIKRLEVTKERMRPFSEISDYKLKFDSADYASKLFNMYSGSEPKPVELICNNELLETMLDRFGETLKLQQYGEDRFLLKTNAVVSDGLAAWVLQFGGRVEVKSPKELRHKVAEGAKAALAHYE